MTPSSAPISPLAFTRAYNTYRADSANIAFADTRLLAAARFWTPFAGSLADPVLSSFIAEDWPPLLDLQAPPDVEDLRPAEIEEIARFLDMVASHRLKSREREAPVDDPVSGAEPPVAILHGSAVPSRFAHYWQAAARKHLYVGDADSALTALKHAGLIDESTVGQLSIPELPETANATDLPSMLAEWAEANHPMSARWFREFDSDWSAKRESGEINRAHCLVVEYDPNGHPVRGRLRTLEGTVEQLKRADAADEVTVHHQVRAPDDPHFGAIYNALAALRRTLRHRGDPSRLQPELRIRHPEERSDEGPAVALRGPRFHARLSLGADTAESHTGDSIGLAAFALAYANWWASDIHRERRLIGSGVAFTGGIAPDGSITPVSPATLRAKIARAFHSPITHLVIPEASRPTAESELAHLRTKHPRRRLHLIGIESPHDLIADHNILRTEKVCLGEFAARKAARWGRSVKVQVPLLVGLMYLLLCLIYPPAWPLMDRRPHHLRGRPTGFQVCNADSTVLWTVNFGAKCDEHAIQWDIGDLNCDSVEEVVVLPRFKDPIPGLYAHFFVYEADGSEMFRRPAVVLGTFPPDTSLFTNTYTGRISILRWGDRRRVVTLGNREYPARGHLQVWSPEGERTGWYINRGYIAMVRGLDGDHAAPQIVVGAINNPMRAAALVILDADGESGIGPPYWDLPVNSNVELNGTRAAYVLFPPSDVSRASGHLYNATRDVNVLPEGTFRFDTDEILEVPLEKRAYLSYTFDSRLRLQSVGLSDSYISERERLVAAGLLEPEPNQQIKVTLQAAVRCWGDTGWVPIETCSFTKD